ncbi:MAG TPA: aminotransferase class I/II-fold pyridoxal phosphate-dependent enzyme [Roseiflexaceae bacterium]|nr:aminotransferase class I/II-fold pyridoxal phosphate-dependent enzyme [Roseiflexaceae bacterium]
MLPSNLYSPRMDQLSQTTARLERWFTNPKLGRKAPEIADFLFGNPQDLPLSGFVAALQTWSRPQSPDWFAYYSGMEHARSVVAETLTTQFGRPYAPADIFMTNGAFGALAVVLDALVGPGDEVIFNLPPWFFYEGMILNVGGTPIRVSVDLTTFDLDLDAIAAAITPHTRVIIVNSPNNPTGKIYPPATLQKLADVLAAASERYGRPIYLISDEAYRRIVFDNRRYASPTTYYANSIMVYTYGKTLLTPGERLGYLALSPEMTYREALRVPIDTAQTFTGLAVPNSLLMHGLADLEALTIDIDHLERRRDRLVDMLQSEGYSVHVPDGSFYLFPRSPWDDDWAFCEVLADHDVFCLPGSVFEMPGHFRLSITASDAMIEQASSGFAAAMHHARSGLQKAT